VRHSRTIPPGCSGSSTSCWPSAEDRYQTATAVRADLERLSGGAGIVASRPRARRLAHPCGAPGIIGTIDEASLSIRDVLAEDISSGLAACAACARRAPRPAPSSANRSGDRPQPRRRHGSRRHGPARRRPGARIANLSHGGERSKSVQDRVDRRVDDLLTTQTDRADVCDGLAASLSHAPAGTYTQDPDAFHA
jgi:hypothetical protein